MPRLTKEDFDLWNQGTHYHSYERLGAHPNQRGCWFSVWAPNADYASVVGDFNDWKPEAHPLKRVGAGLWEGYVRGAKSGDHYKFHIGQGGHQADKTDPYAFKIEAPSYGGSAIEGLASVVTTLDYEWNDQEWMQQRSGPDSLNEPISIYEVHLGSWRHKVHGVSFGYRELADLLVEYVSEMGFTHVELMPVMEHPYYGSWGYQVLGYYAPTFRYGTPEDFMYFVDTMHRNGIGVILDWVPAHFATDPQGLNNFDGSPLYEYEDPVMRKHPDWGTFVFDYNKPGVKNFLISNALFWIDQYHIDGLRVDAVASMLYRDYSRDEWTPNMYGGRENLEAVDLVKKTNEMVFTKFPGAMMFAEESTAWPGVSAPTYDGGLGFLYKWNMGWMHDTLEYMEKDPVHRKYHHGDFSYPLMYAFSEHFTLPLSHDEVVHGKGSLWGKMPGDDWQKAANLRLLYGHMFGHPGKKLLFMGSEFGQRSEWSHDHSIDWHLLEDPLHSGIRRWVQDLNELYRHSPALWKDAPEAFEWIDFQDNENTVAIYRRVDGENDLVFAFNFTPVPREDYRIGLPREGAWTERLNSDSERYCGSGLTNGEHLQTESTPYHGRPFSIKVTVPPLSVLVLEPAS